MRKISVFAGLFILCMTLGAGNLNAACTVTRGKVEVSQGTGSTCTSIQSAVTAAAQVATESNPVIVSVLPGTYSETNGVIMAPFVSLVGCGKDNTKITSTAYATIFGKNNSTIENIWIDNSSPTYDSAAIWNDGVTTTINKVKVTTAVAQLNGLQSYGIYNANGAKIILSNSDIIVTSTGTGARGAIGIWVEGGCDVSIFNSSIIVDSTASLSSFWNVGIHNWSSSQDNITVRDSIIKVIGADYNSGFEVRGPGKVSNTKVEAIATANTVSNNTFLIADNDYHIVNSAIIASGTASQTNCTINNGKYGACLINGPICGGTIVNSWDETFTQIPNQ